MTCDLSSPHPPIPWCCRAVDAGVCGVPSFQVNESEEVIWGQDRFNVVADYMCGLQRAKL